MTPKELKQALDHIYAGVELLRKLFPGRKFTPDGRMVGDIGEAVATTYYDITLDDKSEKQYDASFEVSGKRKRVQIKATFRDELTFRGPYDYYLGIKINQDGSYKEIFNGPGEIISKHYCKNSNLHKNLIPVRNSTLLKLSRTVSEENKIPKRRGVNGVAP